MKLRNRAPTFLTEDQQRHVNSLPFEARQEMIDAIYATRAQQQAEDELIAPPFPIRKRISIMRKFNLPKPPTTADERAAKVLQHLQERTREGIAVTAAQLILLDLSQPEVEEALSFLLHSDLPMLGISIQRNSTGKWTQHFFAFTPETIVYAGGTVRERREQHTTPAWPFPESRDH